MDIWSFLCPNISHHQRSSLRLGKSHSLSTEEESNTHHPRRASVAFRRLSFSVGHKLNRSFPNVSRDRTSCTAEFYRQFSLEDVAMQSNCTVINNKVGPVVIKNCKEEYQMRQSGRNEMGRLHEQSAEHELLLDKFFLLKDHFVGVDRYDTLEGHGVPNLRVLDGSPTIYAVGQPTMNGLQKFTSSLLQKHRHIYYINVRAVPTLFLRRSGDFIPYSAYCPGQGSHVKMYKTERDLHDSERDIQLQALRIASTNGGMFFYYNVLDSSPDEPHMYNTTKMEDLVTSRQMYAKIQSEHQNFKYKRLVLPNIERPSVEWMDSFIDIVKLCAHETRAPEHQNDAIVFQGMTGEGTATLAAITAHLIGKITLKKDCEENYSRICKIESELKWREYVVRNILRSSQLDGDLLQKEVNIAIANSSKSEILQTIINAAKEYKRPWGFLAANKKQQQQRETTEYTTKQSPRKTYTIRAVSTGNITLRDVSELSLQTESSSGELRGNQLIRHEACNEERLLRILLFDNSLYHFLIVFRAYVLEQAPLAFRMPFSKWLVHSPNLVFDLSQTSAVPSNDRNQEEVKWKLTRHPSVNCDISLDPTFHRVVGLPIFGMGQTTPDRFEKLIQKLSGACARKRFRKILFINVREESSFYSCDWQTDSTSQEGESNEICEHILWDLPSNALPCTHGACADMIEEMEERFKAHPKAYSKDYHLRSIEFMSSEGCVEMAPGGVLQTTKEIILELKDKKEIKELCDVSYSRIPIPPYRIPRFQCFDDLIQVVRESQNENSDTALVFFCHNGKKRSTNMMAASCLIMAHLKKFDIEVESYCSVTNELWAPDVEFTRGEYKVVQELIQILPDCHLRKGEVDGALDHCHESMSTMHYHLRENLNPSYRKLKKAKDIETYLTLKHKAYLGLEWYVILILFNYYLHEQKGDLWRSITFNVWMSQHATRLGVLDLLNNFGFLTLGEDYPMNTITSRWLDTATLVRDIQNDAYNLIGYRQRDDNQSERRETPSESSSSSPCF